MSRSPARLAWYRLRSRLHRRRAGYLALAAVAALAAANLIAAVPGRQAARTPAAEALRAE